MANGKASALCRDRSAEPCGNVENETMKTKLVLTCAVVALALVDAYAADSTTAPREMAFETRPLGVKLSVKMVGPYMQAADLQIICAFKHKPSGDTYLGAAKEFDRKVGGILSALRNRGEFVGELGETILFTPPKGSIPAKRVLVIGLGDEAKLSLDTLRIVGRVAAPRGSSAQGPPRSLGPGNPRSR